MKPQGKQFAAIKAKNQPEDEAVPAAKPKSKAQMILGAVTNAVNGKKPKKKNPKQKQKADLNQPAQDYDEDDQA